MSDMSLRPRQGETAEETLARVLTATRKRSRLDPTLLEILELVEEESDHYTAREICEVIRGRINKVLAEMSDTESALNEPHDFDYDDYTCRCGRERDDPIHNHMRRPGS